MIYIVIGVILLILTWSLVVFNNLIKLHTEARESLALIDTYLKQRFDLIPNLVTIAKQYAAHEQQVFDTVTKNRTYAGAANTLEDSIHHNSQLSNALTSFFSVVEAYPELMANQQFRKLATTLITIEKDLTKSRRYYNGVVREYNTLSQQFPQTIVARLFRFEHLLFFETQDVAVPTISV